VYSRPEALHTAAAVTALSHSMPVTGSGTACMQVCHIMIMFVVLRRICTVQAASQPGGQGCKRRDYAIVLPVLLMIMIIMTDSDCQPTGVVQPLLGS
jgi:hypothetical protein